MKKKVIILTTILIIIDQVSKFLFDHFLALNESIKIFDRFLYFTKAYNDGVAFSMLPGKRWLIILVSIVILAFLILDMKKFKQSKRNIIAFALVYGGLIGNLLDRVIHGYVIDFIDFYIFNYNYPIFNFADSFVFIGIGLLIWSIYLGDDNENNS